MKIAICGLIKSENIGEQFIAKSLEYLIETECKKSCSDMSLEFVEVDLLCRNDVIVKAKSRYEAKLKNYYGYSSKGIFSDFFFLGLKIISRKLKHQGIKNFIERIRHFIWKHGRNYRKRMNQFFEMKFKDVDFIVVDGAGLLEYSYNEYQWSLLLVSEYAEKKKIPVVYNAIGRAGEFNEKDFRSTILKKALQSDSVKYVSARDSVKTVQVCAGVEKKVKLLADAAFWLKETYNFEINRDRRKIGIGLIRGNSLSGYGVEFEEEDWLTLFSEIAKELARKGYEYEFFTNGLPDDVKLGKKILTNLNLSDSYLVLRPERDLELYSTINQYQAIITCRMHSSIAAFTLEIPSIILSWNDKVDKLMEIIGYPQRAIKLNDFNAEYIVDTMEKALEDGVDKKKLDKMKEKARESVSDYTGLILSQYKKLSEKNIY